MKLALFGKSIRKENYPYLLQLIDKLEAYKCELLVYEPFLEILRKIVDLHHDTKPFTSHEELKGNANMLFSIGGDGTLLDSVSLVRDSGIPVLGINLGRLGFLSSISRDDIAPAVEKVMKGEFSLEHRTLLHLDSDNRLFGEFSCALNDLTVTRKDSTALIVIHVYVDGVFLNSYWADGLIISTPTGSTGYSLSCGGPVVMPHSNNMILTPVSPHNLNVRPLVVSDTCSITLEVESRSNYFMVSLDSRSNIIKTGVQLKVSKESFSARLIKFEGYSFVNTLRKKLNWGLDVRN